MQQQRGYFFKKTLEGEKITIIRTISLKPEQDAIYMSIPSGKRSSFFGIALELVKNGKIPELPIETNRKILNDIEADEPKTIDDIKHHFKDVKTD